MKFRNQDQFKYPKFVLFFLPSNLCILKEGSGSNNRKDKPLLPTVKSRVKFLTGLGYLHCNAKYGVPDVGWAPFMCVSQPYSQTPTSVNLIGQHMSEEKKGIDSRSCLIDTNILLKLEKVRQRGITGLSVWYKPNLVVRCSFYPVIF